MIDPAAILDAGALSMEQKFALANQQRHLDKINKYTIDEKTLEEVKSLLLEACRLNYKLNNMNSFLLKKAVN